MDADEILARYEAAHADWRARLEAAPAEVYARAPAPGAWTLGQLCDHVALATTLSVDAVGKCAAGDCETAPPTAAAAEVMAAGRLPPVRIAAPVMPGPGARLAAPASLDKDASLRTLEDAAGAMRGARDAAVRAPRGLRRPHPALGPLDALEWYAFAAMHLRHHTRQLKRCCRA